MKKLSGKRTVLIGLCTGVLIVVVCMVVIVYSAWQNPVNAFLKNALASNEQQQASAAFKQNSGAMQTAVADNSEEQQAQKLSQSHIINILLLGIDSNDERQAKDMGWRSDMVMLCTLNTEKNTIALTTIPRDTRTYVYHVDKDGNPTKKGLDKINAAYSYGGGPEKYGPKNAMLAVSDFLSDATGSDIQIQYYISTDMQSIPKLADSFGGVPVQLDVDFPDLGKKGDKVVLTSTNVSLFLENRYDVGGDIARARHHEEFLLGLMKIFKAKGGAEYITAFLGYAAQYARTNLNFEQDVALASLIDKCNTGSVDYRTIGGESKYIDGISYYLPDTEDVKGRIDYLMK